MVNYSCQDAILPHITRVFSENTLPVRIFALQA